VAAILVGGMKCRTQIWRGTTQGSFQKSLVEIGSTVSEEIFFQISSPNLTLDPMGNSHKNLLLRNHWANCNKTLVEWSLDGPLPNMCQVIPTSNQDGRQAKNRKKGGWNLKKIFSSETIERAS
jgi:hypothetical protein